MSLKDYTKSYEERQLFFIFNDDMCVDYDPFRLHPGCFGRSRLHTGHIRLDALHGIYLGGVLMFVKRNKATFKNIYHYQECSINITGEIERTNIYYNSNNFDFPVYIRNPSYKYIIRDYWKLQDERKLMKFWKTDLDIIYK